MNLKTFALAGCLAALAACGDNASNPDALKGASFVSEQPGTNIELNFDANEMRISGRVVNLYNAEYAVRGNQISFGPMASTMMMGPTDAMQTEQDYFQFMGTAASYELKDGRLTIKNPDGKEIVFQQVSVSVPDTSAAETTETVVVETEIETVADTGVGAPSTTKSK